MPRWAAVVILPLLEVLMAKQFMSVRSAVLFSFSPLSLYWGITLLAGSPAIKLPRPAKTDCRESRGKDPHPGELFL